MFKLQLQYFLFFKILHQNTRYMEYKRPKDNIAPLSDYSSLVH